MPFLFLSMPQFNIRPATKEDALAIATVQYHGWQHTYHGIINQAYLDSLSIEKGVDFTKRLLASTQPVTIVMENTEGAVIGYISGGKNRAEELPCDGEIYALYVLKQYHGHGLGKQLFIEAVAQLLKRGYQSVCVFVLKDNPAVGFYKSFKPNLEVTVKASIGNEKYKELGLGWSNSLIVTHV